MDKHRNKIIKYSWSDLSKPVEVEITFEATNHVKLQKVATKAPFPLSNLPPNIQMYLETSTYVPVNDQ